MRSKDTILKKEIYDFVNGWKRDYGTSPSLKNAQFASTDCPFRMNGAGSSVEAV